ncbi:molybdopterin synthase sulfur carrier subunit [Arthrobacter sp. MYb227]|uniref:MoaD/ThiS family protein n=1 Tax=Arthrobacter sp. MYb227 TaxID=1848601 RepID=UPI000CFBB592|nr:MoaD/ThiS family protein [Arthrobacter sp. MYb227]PQZ92871.1 molybdopterin synthase sulfur carrier subunit [Arthrobacter sp. MYb227]
MRIRYFAAAAAAAGTKEEQFDLADLAGTQGPVTLGQVLEALSAREPAAEPVSSGVLVRRATSLATVLSRCSFLINGTSVQDHEHILAATDELDILPPFAGG